MAFMTKKITPMTPVTIPYDILAELLLEGSADTYRLVEDCGEDQKEDDVDEIDGSNGNVETVGLLVHPWAEDADSNEENSLDDDQCDGLAGTSALSESDE